MVDIHSIRSIEGWIEHYVWIGSMFLEKYEAEHYSPRPCFLKRTEVELELRGRKSTVSFQVKAAQLQTSSSHDTVVGLTTIAGKVPMGKYVVGSIGALAFRNERD
jgi:hypothetical protein